MVHGEEKERFTFSVSVVFIQSVVNLLFAVSATTLVSFLPSSKKSEGEITEIVDSPETKRREKDEKRPTEPSILKPQVSKLWLAFELSVPALCQTLSGYMGNKSLEFIDLTTKTVCKSMKPVPILLIGALMGKGISQTSVKIIRYQISLDKTHWSDRPQPWYNRVYVRTRKIWQWGSNPFIVRIFLGACSSIYGWIGRKLARTHQQIIQPIVVPTHVIGQHLGDHHKWHLYV